MPQSTDARLRGVVANDWLIDIEETDDELDALKDIYGAQAQRIRPKGSTVPIEATGGREHAAMSSASMRQGAVRS